MNKVFVPCCAKDIGTDIKMRHLGATVSEMGPKGMDGQRHNQLGGIPKAANSAITPSGEGAL